MTQLRYRKRPVEIEAWRFAEGPKGDGAIEPTPQWLRDAVDAGTARLDPKTSTLNIETLEGVMSANQGDWIIRGVMGEIYPCRADIFELTYEASGEGPSAEWLVQAHSGDRDREFMSSDGVVEALREEAGLNMATYVGRKLVRRDDLLFALGATE